METPSGAVESLIEKAESYGKTSYELAKLRSLEASALIASKLLARVVFILAALMFALFLSVGIALLLGQALGRAYYGFFIVAGFYLIAGLVFYFFLNGWIRKTVSDLIISEVLQ